MRAGVSFEMSSTCVQGGITRPLTGYQHNMMIEPSSPATAWQFNSIVPKQEPMDREDRNDSGINSGSDFHSSSPGSDHSGNIPYSSPSTNLLNSQSLSTYYSTPVLRAGQSSRMMYSQHHIYNDHNPLTPPSEPMVSPKGLDAHNLTSPTIERKCQDMEEDSNMSSFVPSKVADATPSDIHTDSPLRNLEMTLEKNGLLSSPFSPKMSECSDNDGDEYDDQDLRVPKVNSHGKVKTFKCKQCDFVAITKMEFWDHTRSHIKAEKLLTCPQCPFVTEYKHHLEYHLRNHFGSKPFKCSQCKYSCVNKSMLNSHLKSHSNIYQYRCSDCSYATKYCHSLKLHLRKYRHQPAMVLNSDGTPNPLPIIDVYGTRRGPKVKAQEQNSTDEPKAEQILPFAFNQLMFSSPQMQLPIPGFPFFPGLPSPLLLQSLHNLAKAQASFTSAQENSEESSPASQPETEVLDLSKPEEGISKNRRKGRAYKLSSTRGNSSDDEEVTTMFSTVEVVQDKEEGEESEPTKQEEAMEEKPVEPLNNNNDFTCPYCAINFGDAVLYTMHMGYHGYKNPFTCNMCGEECNDKVSFFLHIARTPHS